MSVLSDLFQDIAYEIRKKTGKSDKLSPHDFPAAIRSIVVRAVRYVKLEKYDILLQQEGAYFNNYSVNLSHDGRYLLYQLSSTGQIDIYDIETKTVVWTVRDADGEIVVPGGAGCAFDYTNEAVVGTRKRSGTNVVEVFRATANSFEVMTTYTAGVSTNPAICLACAPDADEIYISHFAQESNGAFLYHSLIYSDGEWKIDSFGNVLANGFLFTSDGKYVVVYGSDIQRVVRKTGEPFGAALTVPGTYHNISLTADNNYVVNTGGGTASDGTKIPIVSVWRVSDYEKMYDFESFFTEQGDAYCIPGTNSIVFAYRDISSVRLFDTSSGSPVESDEIPTLTEGLGGVSDLHASYQGNRFVIVRAGGIEIWNVVDQ